jgi:hypothetical protein
MVIPQISEVRRAIIYERLNDGSPKRTIQEHINILQGTNAQLILRAYFRWNPLDNCDIFTDQYQKDYCLSQGATFAEMSNMNSQIKDALPNILIIGAIPAQRVHKAIAPTLGDYNDYTSTILTPAETEAMALDPARWGITSKTKAQIQAELQLMSGLSGDAWFPDITNPDTQTLLLDWAKRQIDSGVDGLWIDLLYYQTLTMYGITNDINHPSVKQSFDGSNKLVNDIHTYGNSIGRTIYIGAGASSVGLVSRAYGIKTPIDFLAVTPSSSEVTNQQMDAAMWDPQLSELRTMYTDTPIFAFLDSTDDNAPIAKFSQILTTEQQDQFLIHTNEFFKSRNIIFAFPVHGLYMGQLATKLSYGTYNVYDSLAPEFNTYGTIQQLMNTGNLDISSTPEINAAIYVDNILQTGITTPAIISGLTPGDHTCRLTKTGYTYTGVTHFNINAGETTIVSEAMLTIANIRAKTADATTSDPCMEGTCIVNVTIKWTNDGETYGTFTPSISIDGGTFPFVSPYGPEPLGAGNSVTKEFTVTGLNTAGNPHTICPVPN